MTSTKRRLMVGMMMTGLVGTGRPVVAASVDVLAIGRVRSSHAEIGRVLAEASDRSRTFRRLVEAINASDGTVYVEEGKCGYGVRGCLAMVTMAGAHRYLWVKVDTRMTDWDLMALIGHELQHALEVLSDRTVTSGFAMHRFYFRQGSRTNGLAAFETHAAIEAGDAVRTEVRKYRPRTQAR